MNTLLKVVKERSAYFIAAAALTVAIVVPGLVSATQVTQRSIGLSSASAGATGVSYEAKFTMPSVSAGGGAFAIEFCSNSPDVGTDCTAPTGMVTTAATTTSTDFATLTKPSANTIVAAGTIAAGNTIDVTFDGITNTTTAGPLYARIGTYATAAAAETDVVLKTANAVDGGGVAISITPTISVSGAVMESLTFCVASKTITANCGDAASNLPVLRLGEPVGVGTTTLALDPGHLSTGTLFTQLSTNASTGAVVYLKSATDCGGLKRAGATVCDIAPAGVVTGVAAGAAAFGVKTGTASGVGTGANGTIRAAGDYNGSDYLFNYVGANTSGVTGPLGDLILDTNSAPVNNQLMPLTFGASVTNSTPAGNYQTSLSLIATGKF